MLDLYGFHIFFKKNTPMGTLTPSPQYPILVAMYCNIFSTLDLIKTTNLPTSLKGSADYSTSVGCSSHQSNSWIFTEVVAGDQRGWEPAGPRRHYRLRCVRTACGPPPRANRHQHLAKMCGSQHKMILKHNTHECFSNCASHNTKHDVMKYTTCFEQGRFAQQIK